MISVRRWRVSIAAEGSLQVRLLDEGIPVPYGACPDAEARGCATCPFQLARGGAAGAAGPQAAGERIGVGEEREGGTVGVGRLGGDIDHREGRRRLCRAVFGELGFNLVHAAEGTSGREVKVVDDEFGMLAAIAEEVQFVVGGARAVPVEQELVPWPAVQRMSQPQGRPGEDLGVERLLFVDAGVITTARALDDLRDFHRSSGGEPVDGRGGLSPRRDPCEVSGERLAGEDPHLARLHDDSRVGGISSEIEAEDVIALGDVTVCAEQRGERDGMEQGSLAHPERPAFHVG